MKIQDLGKKSTKIIGFSNTHVPIFLARGLIRIGLVISNQQINGNYSKI